MSPRDPRPAIEAFIGRGEGHFETLALALCAWQRAHNPDYAALCAEVEPASWEEIPAVPVTLFRDLPLTSFPVERARVVFRTSGTTTGRRGVVRLEHTEVYDLGARLHAEAVLGPLPELGVSLVSQAPDSSLGHMCAAFVPGMPCFFEPEGGVDVAGAWEALGAATAPLFVPGTAFAFADLIAGARGPLELPVGSIVMVTGGFKGRRLSIDGDALVGLLTELLPGARVVGEYGMSELSSQLWAPRAGDAFVPPPWLRVQAVDPWTGEPRRVGLLRFVDLANHQTVVAIETQDVGEVLPDGRVVLHGRLAGSQPRGCSITVEEANEARLQAREAAPPPLELHSHGGHLHAPFRSHIDGPAGGLPSDHGPALDRISPEDRARVEAVLRALARLRRKRAGPLGQGLHPRTASACLDGAISAIRPEGLARELLTPGQRPTSLTLVVSHGVFTSPIEWACLYAAAGIPLVLKAPGRDPAMCEALVEVFTAEGLPLSVVAGHDLPQSEVIVAFGGDESVEAITVAHPEARVVGHGHRFSLALVQADPAQALAWDAGWYDSRGCMAPAAVFTLGDPEALVEAMAAQLAMVELAMPRGEVDPGLGPEWRRRLGLSRVLGRAVEADHYGVCALPWEHFSPSALPRMVVVHAITGAAQFREAVAPYRRWLGALATDCAEHGLVDPAWAEVLGWFPRICPPGTLQRPPFPRAHFGRPMLGSVLRPGD